MKTFGCVAHVKKVGPGITKLSDRSTKMVFLGYESGTKGYRVFDPVNNQLHVSRDVVFEEQEKWNWDTPRSSGQAETESFIIDLQPTVAEPTMQPAAVFEEGEGSQQDQGEHGHELSPQASLPALPGSPSTLNNSAAGSNATGSNSAGSSDSVQGPVRFRSLTDLFDATEEIHDYEYSGLCLLAADEPASVEEALEEKCWRDAMNAELQSISDNSTWRLTELPKGQRAIGLKWVFKVKKDAAGNIVKHKARLVAKGYAQNKGWILMKSLHLWPD